MTHEEVKDVVREIISDIAPDEEVSALKDDVALKDQIELDSMDFLDIVMELRKRYKIEVPAEDYFQLQTLNSCAEYLKPKFQ